MNNLSTKNRFREMLPNSFADFDTVLDQVFGPNAVRTYRALSASAGASYWEDEQGYHVELDLPGVKREDVELTYDKGALKITAQRHRPQEERNQWHDERNYGEISRTVTLPETIDPESIQAELHDGVLHIFVVKSPEATPRKIEIK